MIGGLRNVETVDFKGIYRGAFGMPPDAELYARIVEAFPDAWIEDPALTPATSAALEPHRDRITWDAGDPRVERRRGAAVRAALPELQAVALRLGEAALRLLRRLQREGIALYGGGQYELGVGRDQIQLLASLFHADAPNDVAPGAYNAAAPVAGLPQSPLALSSRPGFGT